MPCPAERLMLPLFLDVHVLEKNPGNTTMQEMRPTSCTVLLADWPFFTFAPLCCLFTHTERFYKLRCHRPKRKELRTECEFIHVWQTQWEKPVLLWNLPWLAYWIYFLLHWNKRDLYLCQVNNVSILSLLLHMTELRNSCVYLQKKSVLK